MPYKARPFRDVTRRRDNPINNLSRIFNKPEGHFVAGPLTAPQMNYYQDPFYLAELEARLTANDRMLTGPEIQTYVDEVQTMPWPKWQPRAAWPVQVQIRDTAAPFYYSSKITVPSPIRELIVLHELAHHFVGVFHPAHNPLFVQAFLDLIDGVRNPAQADHFRQVFVEHGVKW